MQHELLALTLRYIQECICEEIHGDFLFRAADVEQHMEDTLGENSHLANGDKGAVLNWVKGHDQSVTEPTNTTASSSRPPSQSCSRELELGSSKSRCREACPNPPLALSQTFNPNLQILPSENIRRSPLPVLTSL